MCERTPAAPTGAARLRKQLFLTLALHALLLACAPLGGAAQAAYERDFDVPEPAEVVIKNRDGRVTVIASEGQKKISLRATSPNASVSEANVQVARGEKISIDVGRMPPNAKGGASAAAYRDRIDIIVRVPARSRVKVVTQAGAVDVVGDVSFAAVATETGTIRADVPLDALHYTFQWTLARPRFFSEVELPKVRERRGGVYEISGRFPVKSGKGEKGKKTPKGDNGNQDERGETEEKSEVGKTGDRREHKAKREERINLEFQTARGVILFGVADESSVPSDLHERALTESARAIIRSGDEDLIEAIRKVAPRLVGDYTTTLPPRAAEPSLSTRRDPFNVRTRLDRSVARLQARVTDRNGRAITGLSEKDFAVFEDGEERPIRAVELASAPFNLVLLLDVSGSVEERLDFIRKAALAFINTTGAQDRVAVISFRDDVQLISDFTTDRRQLAQSIKAIQAGGGTALYDSIAYSLVHTLKPLRGERTAVVILSDGDDNKSFIPFPAIVEATIESGALIYPLYIPSGLIPADSANTTALSTPDPLRTRYLALASRADAEGRQLASVSGGAYYPITRLDQLQRAYDDVVAQLRTSYSITYESKPAARTTGDAARVRVRVAREGATVRLSPSIEVTPPATP